MIRMQKTWDTTFSQCTGKDITCNNDSIRLRRGITFADEIGRCNDRDRELIAGLRQAQKTFLIQTLDTNRARLCPYLDCEQENGELDILINGHPTRIQWRKDRPYWEDRWTPVAIPVEHLRTGENEGVFQAVGDARWTLLIENGRQPDRSAISEDGGHTWRSEDLGVNNGADGEYMVRLYLDQHPESAECCSEPVDTLALEGGIAPHGHLHTLQFETRSETPSGTSIALFWRGGPSPTYDPSLWNAWQPAEGELTPDPKVRFVQWRAVLQTSRPSVTPVLEAIHLTVQLDIIQETTAQLTEADNPDLLRSPYRFAYMSVDEKRGKLLRDRWKLNDVVRNAQSEFDTFLHLRQWVREQWEDGWDMGDIDFCPPWDAALILELTSRKLSLGMCTHYATVMSQCSAALGLVARTQIMRSHCINEVWSGEHNKWVAMDVGGDNNDETKFTYHFERNGNPLSALECHEAWVNENYGDVTIVPQPPPATDGRYEVAKRLRLFERFMISLRNDELATMEPGEPEHGKGSYHYDGYLFWQDDKTDPLPWFSHHTDRPADLYWTVNRAKIHLSQGETPNRLHVLLDTETPNLKGFEIRVNEKDWTSQNAAFDWTVQKGENRLEVRPVNAFGRKGGISWLEVHV
ncbi:MAG: hypothetical protein O7G87_22715 [bacterium]|nr:hypothetical protein [bacterium]